MTSERCWLGGGSWRLSAPHLCPVHDDGDCCCDDGCGQLWRARGYVQEAQDRVGVVRELAESGLVDELLGRVDRDGLALTGEGGFLPELVKAVLERGLAAELTGHLGYKKGDPAGREARTAGTGQRRRRWRPRSGRWGCGCRGTGTPVSSRAWCRRVRGGCPARTR